MENKEINTNSNEKNNEKEKQNGQNNEEKKPENNEEEEGIVIKKEAETFDERDLLNEDEENEIENLIDGYDNTKKFNFNSASFFLTYPHTDVEPLQFFKDFCSIMAGKKKEVIKMVVSREDHKDTYGKHMHVWGLFAKKVHTRDVKFFDFWDRKTDEMRHPHICTPKNKIACIKYVVGCTIKKKDDPKDLHAYRIDITNYLKGIRQHKPAEDMAKMMKKEMSPDEFVEKYPQALMRLDKIQKNLDLYHNMKAAKEVENEGDGMVIDRRCYWIVGTPGIGKSWAVRHLYAKKDIYVKDCNKWWDRYVDQKAVLLDDFGNPNMLREINIWSDRYVFTGEVKGGQVLCPYKEFYVTSNYDIPKLFMPKKRDPETGAMVTDWDDYQGQLLVESVRRRFVFIRADLYTDERGRFNFYKALASKDVQEQIAKFDALYEEEKAGIEDKMKRLKAVADEQIKKAKEAAELHKTKMLLLENEPYDEIAIFPDDDAETIKTKREMSESIKNYFYYYHNLYNKQWNEEREETARDLCDGDYDKVFDMYLTYMKEMDETLMEKIKKMKVIMRMQLEKKHSSGIVFKKDVMPTQEEMTLFLESMKVISKDISDKKKLALLEPPKELPKKAPPKEEPKVKSPPKEEPKKEEPKKKKKEPKKKKVEVKKPDPEFYQEEKEKDLFLNKKRTPKLPFPVFGADMDADAICKVLKEEAKQEAERDAKTKEVKDDVVPDDLDPAVIEQMFMEKEKEREEEKKKNEDPVESFLKRQRINMPLNVLNPVMVQQMRDQLVPKEEPHFEPFPLPSPKTSPQPSLRDLYIDIDEPAVIPFKPSSQPKVVPFPNNFNIPPEHLLLPRVPCPSAFNDEEKNRIHRELEELKRKDLEERERKKRELEDEREEMEMENWKLIKESISHLKCESLVPTLEEEEKRLKKEDEEQKKKFKKMKKYLDIETTKDLPTRITKAEKKSEVTAPGYKEINLANYDDDDFDVNKKYSEESSLGSFIADDDEDVYAGRKRKLRKGLSKKQKRELDQFMEEKGVKKRKEEKKDPSKYRAKYPDARLTDQVTLEFFDMTMKKKEIVPPRKYPEVPKTVQRTLHDVGVKDPEVEQKKKKEAVQKESDEFLKMMKEKLDEKKKKEHEEKKKK